MIELDPQPSVEPRRLKARPGSWFAPNSGGWGFKSAATCTIWRAPSGTARPRRIEDKWFWVEQKQKGLIKC